MSNFVPWDHFCDDGSIFCHLTSWNAQRFWTTSAIKTFDPLLERYLFVDFKNRHFVDVRAQNFPDVTFLKYEISTMWPRWWCHETVGSTERKIFQLEYFWTSFRKSHRSLSPNRKVALKQSQFYYQGVPWSSFPNPCRVKTKNGTQGKRWDRLITKRFTKSFKEGYLHKIHSPVKISWARMNCKKNYFGSFSSYHIPKTQPKKFVKLPRQFFLIRKLIWHIFTWKFLTPFHAMEARGGRGHVSSNFFPNHKRYWHETWQS